MHEYNLRRMPECWWYAKYGYCSAGDECLYAHPKERRIECPDYNRGFCKLGEFQLIHGLLLSMILNNFAFQVQLAPESMFVKLLVSST